MKKRKTFVIMLLLFVLFTGTIATYAAPLKGKQSYTWSKTTFCGPNVGNKYETWTAKYDNWNGPLIIENLSGTKRWENYGNKKKTAQTMTVGISKTKSVSKTYSYKLSSELGLSYMSQNKTIATKIGGDYTKAKTYAKTEGTSSAYELNTKSKNGYYAVCHCVMADRYKTTYKKTGCAGNSTKTGKLYRFTTKNGYEELVYKKKPF